MSYINRSTTAAWCTRLGARKELQYPWLVLRSRSRSSEKWLGQLDRCKVFLDVESPSCSEPPHTSNYTKCGDRGYLLVAAFICLELENLKLTNGSFGSWDFICYRNLNLEAGLQVQLVEYCVVRSCYLLSHSLPRIRTWDHGDLDEIIRIRLFFFFLLFSLTFFPSVVSSEREDAVPRNIFEDPAAYFHNQGFRCCM